MTAIKHLTSSIQDHPASNHRLDRMLAVFMFTALLGIFFDSWAHNQGAADESFFSIYHAALYSSYALIALVLGFVQVTNVQRGHALTRALPRGYLLSLMGVGLFGLAGMLDMFWHGFFGVEGGIEILISPTHVLMLSSYLMMLCGWLIAAWNNPAYQTGWRQLWSVILVWMTIVCLLTLVFQQFHFSHALEYLTKPHEVTTQWIYNEAGVAGFLIGGTVTAVGLLIFLQRWRLPFGAMTILTALNAALMCVMTITDYGSFATPVHGLALLVGISALGGFACDLFLAWLKPSAARITTIHAAVFVVPALLAFTSMASAHVFGQVGFGTGLWWRVHLWTGIPPLVGLIGVGLSVLMSLRTFPDTRFHS